MSNEGWEKICQECTGYYDGQCHYCDGKNHFRPYRWVSVKDRLPDPGQDYDCVQVLVYYRDQVTGQMDMRTEYFWKDSVIIDNDVPGFCIYGITHWMPLPAAPEDK
jgi:hypothetical protein